MANDAGPDHRLRLSGDWRRAPGRDGSPAVRFGSGSLGKAPDHSDLDPGWSAFAFGVAFRFAAGTAALEGTDSPNLLQKGSFGDAGQWKLQVSRRDGGRVQCRVKGSSTAVLVTSSVARVAADSRWHRAVCVRRDARVVLIVDGERTVREVHVGAVNSRAPVTVANKRQSVSSDQFRGIIDAVAVAKGRHVVERVRHGLR